MKDSDNPEAIRRAISDHQPGIIGESSVIETAILIPLTERHESVHVVFERRAEDLSIQPGDVCFPGGFRDSKDETLRETAVRETAEELGIPERSVTVWKQFDSMLIPWQLEIRSFVGWLNENNFQPDTTEVAEVFTVPLETIHDQEPQEHEVELVPDPGENFPYDRIPGGRDYNWQPRRIPELFYEFKGRTVWGITARVLQRFLDVIKS